MVDITNISNEVAKEISNSVAKDALKPDQISTQDTLKEVSFENTVDSQNKAQSDGSFSNLNEMQNKADTNLLDNNNYWENGIQNDFHFTEITRDTPTPIELKENSNYSDNTTKYIRSTEEYDLYNDNSLNEKEVNGRTILQRNDIDPNLKDDFGRTNKERMAQGKSPIGDDGKPINLHHVGQKQDSPLAELTDTEHKQNSKILHDNNVSEVDHQNLWAKEKSEYWKERSKDF